LTNHITKGLIYYTKSTQLTNTNFTLLLTVAFN